MALLAALPAVSLLPALRAPPALARARSGSGRWRRQSRRGLHPQEISGVESSRRSSHPPLPAPMHAAIVLGWNENKPDRAPARELRAGVSAMAASDQSLKTVSMNVSGSAQNSRIIR